MELDQGLRGLELRATRCPFHLGDGVELRVRERGTNNAIIANIEVIEEGARFPVLVEMSLDESQLLMDQLWECGLRPTEGSGSSGSLAATERHLRDMRAIVFSQMEMESVRKLDA